MLHPFTRLCRHFLITSFPVEIIFPKRGGGPANPAPSRPWPGPRLYARLPQATFCSALPLGGRASSEGGPWVCRDVTAGRTPSFCFAAGLGCGGSEGEGVGTGGVRSEAAARGAKLSSPQPHRVGRRERCVEGMSAFSEAALEKKLSELSNSQQSVQTLSRWLIHHRKHSRPIVTVWERELRKGELPAPRRLRATRTPPRSSGGALPGRPQIAAPRNPSAWCPGPLASVVLWMGGAVCAALPVKSALSRYC